MQAPALHILPKSKYGPCDEARALVRAARGAQYSDEFSPVFFGNKIIGSVFGDNKGNLWITPQHLAGFPGGYADVVTALRNGQSILGAFKIDSSTGVNDSKWSDAWTNLASSAATAYSGTTLTARQLTDTSQGSINHGGNVSTAQKHLLSYRLQAGGSSSTPGMMWWMYDKVIQYDECTIAIATQTMTNTLTAQRWVGTGLPGLRICPTVSQTGSGATASHYSGLTYVNEASVGSRAMPLTRQLDIPTSSITGSSTFMSQVMLVSATGNFGTSPFLPLAAGDIGVSSITNYITAVANTGTISFGLIRPLLMIVSPDSGCTVEVDLIRDRCLMPRIYDGASINFLFNNVTGTGDSGVYSWSMDFVWN